MTPSVQRLGDERGIALILALMVLLTLSALALALLASSALEPRISRNLHDASRARWLTEAGIELGYGLLAAAGDGTWNALLATADASWVVLPRRAGAALPGVPPARGTYAGSTRTARPAAAARTGRWAGPFTTTTRTSEVVQGRRAERP